MAPDRAQGKGKADCATPPLHGTTAAAEMVARQAAANGDELLNLTMAVNGKGVHKMETHKAIYEELKKAEDADELTTILRAIGEKFAQDGTYLAPF